VELFGADFLREPRRDRGSGEGTIDLGRKLENRGTWEHRQEWTVPPPPPLVLVAEVGDDGPVRRESSAAALGPGRGFFSRSASIVRIHSALPRLLRA
jgi:hypothetical protein